MNGILETTVTFITLRTRADFLISRRIGENTYPGYTNLTFAYDTATSKPQPFIILFLERQRSFDDKMNVTL